MKMRKSLAVAGMICVALLAGCGSDKQTSTNTQTSAPNTQESVKGYVFEVNGIQIGVDMDASTVVSKLGDPVSYFEEPSCAAQGIAKLYTYASYEIDTYPDGDKDLIATIILKDDNVKTAEGIDISKTKADVIAVYGDKYEETAGQIAYVKDGMKLCFILDGDNIASIEYNSSVVN